MIAESLEAAREGVAAVKVNYEIATPKVDLIAEQLRAIRPEIWGGRLQLQAKKREPDIVWVNAPSEHKTEFDYSTPIENHNPIEPPAALVNWSDPDRVTFYLSTRGIDLTQKVIALAFGLQLENARVIWRFLGGHFGSKGLSWVLFFSSDLRRRSGGTSVRPTLTRPQIFTSLGQRAYDTETGFAAGDK